MDHAKTCSCGRNSASFHFKDDVLPFEVISQLYCPSCSGSVGFNPGTMLPDNGWIIEYDMEIARFMGRTLPGSSALNPEYLFDEGYCTWRGVYPADHIDSARERQALADLAKTDPKKYFNELKSWANTRMERLAREGWRKANERESVVT
jgi:hypothetical protein